MAGREFDPGRRKLLKLAGLGLLTAACEPLSRFTPTPRPPTPEPTPTPERAILWTQDLLIPSELPSQLPSRQKPEAFYAQGGSILSTNPEGYPISHDLEGKQLWAWNGRGTVWGADEEMCYVVRADKRPYALNGRTGEPRWRYIWSPKDKSMFPTYEKNAIGETQLDWPFWLGKERIFLPFWSELGGSFTPRVHSCATLDKKTGDFKGIWEITILGKIGNVLLVSDTFGPWYERRQPGKEMEMAGWEIEDKLRPIWDRTYRPEMVLKRYYLSDSSQKLFKIYVSAPSSFKQNPDLLVVLDVQTGEELWFRSNSQTKGGEGDLQFAGQVGEMVLIVDKNRGITYSVTVLKGLPLWQNEELVIDQTLGISQNTLVTMRKGPDILYGLNPENGRRVWYWELNKLTAPPVIHQDKIVYGSGPYLLVLDPETGRNTRNAPITLRQGEATKLVPHQDLLLVQTGKPGGRGTLSAIKI